MNNKTLAIAASLLFTSAAWAQSPVQSCDSTPKPPFCNAVSGDRAQGWPTQHRSEVIARNGVVATSQSLAAQAGLDILKRGGNAIDAAVATAATLSVVEPMNVGPAGDLFAIIYIASEKSKQKSMVVIFIILMASMHLSTVIISVPSPKA
jgi:gamma-glutamyltranspeptidase/glutathione hydrolase